MNFCVDVVLAVLKILLLMVLFPLLVLFFIQISEWKVIRFFWMTSFVYLFLALGVHTENEVLVAASLIYLVFFGALCVDDGNSVGLILTLSVIGISAAIVCGIVVL